MKEWSSFFTLKFEKRLREASGGRKPQEGCGRRRRKAEKRLIYRENRCRIKIK